MLFRIAGDGVLGHVSGMRYFGSGSYILRGKPPKGDILLAHHGKHVFIKLH